MSTLLELETAATSPLAERAIQARVVSADEAAVEAERVFYGSRSKKTLAKVVGGLLIALIFSLQFLYARNPDKLIQNKLVGGTLMLIVVVGMGVVVYEWLRKYRVFVLDEEFAVEGRLSQEVELFKWSDIAKVYCLDRTTTTRIYVSIFPVGSSSHHEGKLRIVLVDGRQIVLTKDMFGFSELAYQVTCRATAAQLVACTKFVLESKGTLEFDKLRLTSDGLWFKRKFLAWSDILRVSKSQRGAIKFQTKKLWWSPRFAIEAIPNVMLLLEVVSMFGVECVQDG